MSKLLEMLGLTVSREPAKVTPAPAATPTPEMRLDNLLRSGAPIGAIAKQIAEMNLLPDQIITIERAIPKLEELRAFGSHHCAKVAAIEDLILELPYNFARRNTEAALERARIMSLGNIPYGTPWENGAPILDPVRRAEFEKEKAAEKKRADDEREEFYKQHVREQEENRKNGLRAGQGFV